MRENVLHVSRHGVCCPTLARLYHSASSYALGKRCLRAWFYRYVRKIRDPFVAWADIAHYVADRSKDAHGVLWWRDPSDASRACTSRQRSAALGTEMHARIERWYHHAPGDPPVDFYDLPGKIALSGLALLPAPDGCHAGDTESAIGVTPFRARGSFDPPRVHVVNGIAWAGFRDLIVSAPGEFLRLGIEAPDGWALFDYKSTADISRYALTAADLRTDFQAALYADATCEEHDIQELPARWVYFETRERRRAAGIDVTLPRDAAHAAVEAASNEVRGWDALGAADERDAPCNTNACGEYGGCMYHKSAGGPCDARRSIGKLIQLQTRVVRKGINQMALPGNAANKFAGLKAGTTAAPEQANAGQNAAEDAGQNAASEAQAPDAAAPPAARGRGRPRKTPAPAPADAPTETSAEAPATTAADPYDGLQKTIILKGDFGPVAVTGHASDVVDLYNRLAS